MAQDSKKKILVVEDEKPLAMAMSDKLDSAGFSVLQAHDGEAGLELAFKEQPDLILLDIIMPKMDGMAMLDQLREDEWGKNVPVILLTNLSEQEKVATAVENRVFDYLVKSDWKIADVVERVKERLGMNN